ncbi:hypothetical protein FRC12_020803, partial [Ceratobasidium sp. 428]
MTLSSLMSPDTSNTQESIPFVFRRAGLPEDSQSSSLARVAAQLSILSDTNAVLVETPNKIAL